jgi:hypothetical protein
MTEIKKALPVVPVIALTAVAVLSIGLLIGLSSWALL